MHAVELNLPPNTSALTVVSVVCCFDKHEPGVVDKSKHALNENHTVHRRCSKKPHESEFESPHDVTTALHVGRSLLTSSSSRRSHTLVLQRTELNNACEAGGQQRWSRHRRIAHGGLFTMMHPFKRGARLPSASAPCAPQVQRVRLKQECQSDHDDAVRVASDGSASAAAADSTPSSARALKRILEVNTFIEVAHARWRLSARD
jgi:hypothetical protein